MGHGAGHGRKKKNSILRKLAQSSLHRLVPDTYSRRMTRYSAYDADAVTIRVRLCFGYTEIEMKLKFAFFTVIQVMPFLSELCFVVS